jgi:hypothetical protein
MYLILVKHFFITAVCIIFLIYLSLHDGLKITQSVILIDGVMAIILFMKYFPDGSGDLLVSVGNNITYLSINYYLD